VDARASTSVAARATPAAAQAAEVSEERSPMQTVDLNHDVPSGALDLPAASAAGLDSARAENGRAPPLPAAASGAASAGTTRLGGRHDAPAPLASSAGFQPHAKLPDATTREGVSSTSRYTRDDAAAADSAGTDGAGPSDRLTRRPAPSYTQIQVIPAEPNGAMPMHRASLC
jgi:hypothetical protein